MGIDHSGASRFGGKAASLLRRTADRLELGMQNPVEEPAVSDPSTDPVPAVPSAISHRSTFRSLLETALERARADRTSVAVIMADIDQFNALNASHGAMVGDEVLAEVGKRLTRVVRPGDRVARLMNDEFLLICHSDEGNDVAFDVSTRIHRSFDPPMETSAGNLRVTVSIGTTTVQPEQAPGAGPESIVRQAETALQKARSRGRSQLMAFDHSMQQQAVQRYHTEHELRWALDSERIDVHYQPFVSLHTGEILGMEALARWEHQEMGPISPGLFIPVAEESGLINDLGLQVLSSSIRQGAQWSTEENSSRLISINLSINQLLDQDLTCKIVDLLERHELSPRQLCLEITESVVMSDVAASMTILGQLKDQGICLAIDDFGTGYSSLSYLRRLPVDLLKIDQSFIGSIFNRDDRVITKAIIDLAHTLGMTTIAEGVETRMQLEILDALGCDMAQGFLLQRPAPANAIDFSPIDFNAIPESIHERTVRDVGANSHLA